MEIIKKSVLPTGESVQLEKWGNCYGLAVYIPARRDHGYFIKRGDLSRVDFYYNSGKKALYIFGDLVTGRTTPEKLFPDAWSKPAAADILGL